MISRRNVEFHGFLLKKENIHADVILIRVVSCMWRQIFGKQCFQSLGSHRSIPSHGKKQPKEQKRQMNK